MIVINLYYKCLNDNLIYYINYIFNFTIMSTNEVIQEINSNTKSKWHSILIAFSFLILFSLLFIFESNIGELWPIWDISSLKIKDFFDEYAIYSWILIAFLSVILFFILNIFTRFIKNYKIYFQLFLIILSLLPWYIFANQLVYHENRYSDISKAIISYIWYPLLVTINDFVVVLIIIIIAIKIILFIKNKVLWKILEKKS